MQNLKNKKIDFFWGPHLSRFDLNNYDFNLHKKDFSWKKWPKFARFPRKIKIKIQIAIF
jgi:hypothetical protein